MPWLGSLGPSSVAFGPQQVVHCLPAQPTAKRLPAVPPGLQSEPACRPAPQSVLPRRRTMCTVWPDCVPDRSLRCPLCTLSFPVGYLTNLVTSGLPLCCAPRFFPAPCCLLHPKRNPREPRG